MNSRGNGGDQVEGDENGRTISGGYDFGGYVPGEDYLPKRRSRSAPVAAFVSIILIIALVVWSIAAVF